MSRRGKGTWQEPGCGRATRRAVSGKVAVPCRGRSILSGLLRVEEYEIPAGDCDFIESPKKTISGYVLLNLEMAINRP